MNNKLFKYINIFRQLKSKSDFKVSLLNIHIIFLLISIILVIIESLFYLSPNSRFPLVTYFISAYLICFVYIILKYFFNYNNLFHNSSDESIAKLIGDKSNSIKDRLLNAYQLESQLNIKNKIEYEF